MGEHEGEITISAKGSSYRPPKLALILLFVAICGFFLGLELESRNDDNGVDCDNPETLSDELDYERGFKYRRGGLTTDELREKEDLKDQLKTLTISKKKLEKELEKLL